MIKKYVEVFAKFDTEGKIIPLFALPLLLKAEAQG